MSLSTFALLVLLQGPQSLPAVQVKDLNGTAALLTDLVPEGRWVLVYVQPRCTPCEGLLGTLKKDDVPPEAKIVVVIGSSQADAAPFAMKFPNLAAASWYIDKGRDAFEGLKLPGVPVVLGMRGGQIAWRLAGVLPKSSDMRSILLSWIEEVRTK